MPKFLDATGLSKLLQKINQVLNDKLNEKADKSELQDYSPVGTVITFAGTSAPDKYLICNGSAVSRTTYAELYAVIGTKYGTGDGSTTFNLPNLVDKFIEGTNASGVGTVVGAGLPNITGSIRSFSEYNKSNTSFTSQVTGAFYWVSSWDTDSSKAYGTSTNLASGTNDTVRNVPFDASRCSSIYGASSTVQPPAVKMLCCIKAKK